MDDATLAQTRAAQPTTSTWLGANAGSGKTRVLTDRVARLLLGGVRPERILCLTYTKAAAMEMQNRLFERLGAWAMKDDNALRTTLAEIGVDALDDSKLDEARTLFARAIEAPGGLKIQTIHSFCSSVLRRFPLEARVSPAFTEIDDRVQSRLLSDLLDDMAEDPRGQEALGLIAAHLSDDTGAVTLARAVAGKAESLTPAASWEAICDWAGIAPDVTEEEIVRNVIVGGEGDLAQSVLPHLDPEARSTATVHRALSQVDWLRPELDDLALLEKAFLTGDTAKVPYAPKIDKIGNKYVRAAIGENMAALNELMDRIANTRQKRTNLMTARITHALHRFAEAFLPVYAEAKQARGWLDFDDLIDKTRTLLSDRDVAQWVLFRLDGGIDHILVDEAQDTSPRQWDIVKRLAEDFAAGEGARTDVQRTIFVVGDKKQSIYSFQGADPEEFDRMRDYFEERLRAIGAPFEPHAQLIHSFRSAPPILALVDAVAEGFGAPGLGEGVEHKAFFEKPGRVDLWPHIAPKKAPEKPNWDDPQDLVSEDHHTSVLAEALAVRIKDMIENPVEYAPGKPVTAGDILILLRRRSPLFHKIIAELKTRHLPVAGVDRSQLTSPLAVKDLLALCRFLATPEDDLSLACVLRSPLIGLSEAELYDLAHNRGKDYLRQVLWDRRDEFPEAYEILRDLRKQADFLRPYDLLERALIRHNGRRRLIARLGREAEDAIDAMLAQALSYEASEVPSLTGFVGWLESGDVQVKRDLSKAEGQIRVMTVHGAKGLEAPVVILPDCGSQRGSGGRIKLLHPEGGPVVWQPSNGNENEGVVQAKAAAKEREAEELNRLLYVALTRAESWLIVAAAGELGKNDNPASCWYKIVQDAMKGMGAQPYTVPGLDDEGLRLETGTWPEVAAPNTMQQDPIALPEWTNAHAPRPAKDQDARTPSDLGGAKALPGVGDETDVAMRRGSITHLLLEHLPRIPAPAWPTAAPGIAAQHAGDVSEAELAPMLEEVTRVLNAPSLAHVFAPETLAEVEITGHSATLDAPMLGIIDRLIVKPDRILAVDFKTNATVPACAEDTPEGLLRQMGAYVELLQAVYPDREIAAAILWSRSGDLMELPHDLVSDALKRARGA
jgi:ATP-dependent helicase/nuclease subunit A